MKKYILLLLIPFFSFTSKHANFDIIGKWKGKDKGEIAYLIFDNEGYFTMEVNGERMGGKNFTMRGKKAKAKYNYRSTKKPIEIDIIISDIQNKLIKKINFIVEFKDKNTMKLTIPSISKEVIDEKSIQFTRVE